MYSCEVVYIGTAHNYYSCTYISALNCIHNATYNIRIIISTTNAGRVFACKHFTMHGGGGGGGGGTGGGGTCVCGRCMWQCRLYVDVVVGNVQEMPVCLTKPVTGKMLH